MCDFRILFMSDFFLIFSVCVNGTSMHRVGRFTRELDSCVTMNCFCNQDAYMDCPAWDSVDSCIDVRSLFLEHDDER